MSSRGVRGKGGTAEGARILTRAQRLGKWCPGCGNGPAKKCDLSVLEDKGELISGGRKALECADGGGGGRMLGSRKSMFLRPGEIIKMSISRERGESSGVVKGFFLPKAVENSWLFIIERMEESQGGIFWS